MPLEKPVSEKPSKRRVALPYDGMKKKSVSSSTHSRHKSERFVCVFTQYLARKKKAKHDFSLYPFTSPLRRKNFTHTEAIYFIRDMVRTPRPRHHSVSKITKAVGPGCCGQEENRTVIWKQQQQPTERDSRERRRRRRL